jgi:hypothetical protein
MDSSISQLKAWFTKMDDELKAVVEAFSNEELKKGVDRSGYPMPVETQLEVYLQAMLIIFGKATVYFRAMNKPLPETVEQWIG